MRIARNRTPLGPHKQLVRTTINTGLARRGLGQPEHSWIALEFQTADLKTAVERKERVLG